MHDPYAAAGVKATLDTPVFRSLTDRIASTFGFREGLGGPLLPLGHYANVLDLGSIGLAVSMDGVGTKLLVAQQAGDYRSIGADLVAMNVNDLLCVGADPIAMLDYVAVESLESRSLPGFVDSLVAAAEEAGITIPGGEVAQVAELLAPHVPGEALDVVGTALGLVDPGQILTGEAIAEEDVLIGLASSGIHSNGFTLARRVLLRDGWTLESAPAELGGRTLAEELLIPTRIYVRCLRAIWAAGLRPHALFHITGEGLLNLLRAPGTYRMEVEAWPAVPALFGAIAARGGLDAPTMYTTFNMGVGLIIVATPTEVEGIRRMAESAGIAAWVLGRVAPSATREVVAPVCGVRSENARLIPL